MDTEDKIRKLMRQFDVTCPSCGSDCISVDEEQNTDLGIMDEIVCSDCESAFYMISTVTTQIVPIDKE